MTLSSTSLAGRRAVVTASGGQMGGAIALRLAAAGADVVLNDIIPGSTGPYAEQIRAMGRNVIEVEADPTFRPGAEAVIGAAIDTWGGVDILVNNVGGVQGPYTNELLRIEDDDWDATLRICLKATFLCTKLVVPGMIERRDGKIVNTASTTWSGGVAPYAVAKAGVVAFTRGLAGELGKHNINVNAVAPGATLDALEALAGPVVAHAPGPLQRGRRRGRVGGLPGFRRRPPDQRSVDHRGRRGEPAAVAVMPVAGRARAAESGKRAGGANPQL